MSINKLLQELEFILPTSNWTIRKEWAHKIISTNIDVSELLPLVYCEKKVVTYFMYLLSDIGSIAPNELRNVLPKLLSLSQEVKQVDFKISFTRLWQVAGVPVQDESKAITMLFDWINDPTVEVTNKSRAIFVLEKLVVKYPDLKNEYINSLEVQRDKYSEDFAKRVDKIILKQVKS